MKLRDLRWDKDYMSLFDESYSQRLIYARTKTCTAVRRNSGPYAGTYYLRETGYNYGRRIGAESMTELELACYLVDVEEQVNETS